MDSNFSFLSCCSENSRISSSSSAAANAKPYSEHLRTAAFAIQTFIDFFTPVRVNPSSEKNPNFLLPPL